MLTKIALSVALVLGTASGVLAATKHSARHHATMGRNFVAAGAYGAYGSVMPGRKGETGAVLIQDRDFSDSIGTPYCGGKC